MWSRYLRKFLRSSYSSPTSEGNTPKFGTVKLIELHLGDDPVIDTPPTGSPEFDAFVAHMPDRLDEARSLSKTA